MVPQLLIMTQACNPFETGNLCRLWSSHNQLSCQVCVALTNGGARGVRSSVFQSGARHGPISHFEVQKLRLASGWGLGFGDLGILLFLPVDVFTWLAEFAVSFITLDFCLLQRGINRCTVSVFQGERRRIPIGDAYSDIEEEKETIAIESQQTLDSERVCLQNFVFQRRFKESIYLSIIYCFWTASSNWVRCLKFGFVWFYFPVGHGVCGVCCGTLEFAWFCYSPHWSSHDFELPRHPNIKQIWPNIYTCVWRMQYYVCNIDVLNIQNPDNR